MIISQFTGQPVKIVFAMVGKGKALHYSTGNDDTLCGRMVSSYVDGNEGTMCKRCATVERVRSAEYDAWEASPVTETAPVAPHTDAQSVSVGSDEWLAARTVETSDECTCSKGAPSPGNSPCLHCGGDNSWCAKHYPAPPVADGTDVRFPMVTIQGEYTEPTTMIVDGEEIPYDAFLSMAIQERARIDADGGCIGLCGLGTGCGHCDETYGALEPVEDAQSVSDEFVPMDRTGDSITSVMTVMVIQNSPGMTGVTHYHAPECRDIQREMNRWGQRSSDAFENGFNSVAEILEFECGDIASDSAESNTPEWWAEIFRNATPGVHGGVKIMSCLDIPNGVTSDGSPVIRQGNFYRAGFKREEMANTLATGGSVIDPVCGCERFANPAEVPCPDHTTELDDTRCGRCGVHGTKSDLAMDTLEGHVCGYCAEKENDDSDAGFVETLVTKEYELSVIVDESTGASVSLGWVMLEMNAAQAMDYDRVAEEYGRTHGKGTPRHGWASIITVHDVADL